MNNSILKHPEQKDFRTLEVKRPPAEHTLCEPLAKVCMDLILCKSMYRQGWGKRNIIPEQCESTADHSYGVAKYAYLMAVKHCPHLDPHKVLLLGLLHDSHEGIAGDLTPACGVSPEEKTQRELNAFEEMFGHLVCYSELLGYLEEYNNASSPEGAFVKQIDKLDVLLQCYEYSKSGFTHCFEEFATTAFHKIKEPCLVDIRDALIHAHIAEFGEFGKTYQLLKDAPKIYNREEQLAKHHDLEKRLIPPMFIKNYFEDTNAYWSIVQEKVAYIPHWLEEGVDREQAETHAEALWNASLLGFIVTRELGLNADPFRICEALLFDDPDNLDHAETEIVHAIGHLEVLMQAYEYQCSGLSVCFGEIHQKSIEGISPIIEKIVKELKKI